MWAISTSHSAAAASLAATKRSRGALDCWDGANGVPGSVPLEHEPSATHDVAALDRFRERIPSKELSAAELAGVVAMLPCGDERHSAGAGVDGGICGESGAPARAAPARRRAARRRRAATAAATLPLRQLARGDGRELGGGAPQVVGRGLSAESHPRRACVGPPAGVAASRARGRGRRRRAVGGAAEGEPPVDAGVAVGGGVAARAAGRSVGRVRAWRAARGDGNGGGGGGDEFSVLECEAERVVGVEGHAVRVVGVPDGAANQGAALGRNRLHAAAAARRRAAAISRSFEATEA